MGPRAFSNSMTEFRKLCSARSPCLRASYQRALDQGEARRLGCREGNLALAQSKSQQGLGFQIADPRSFQDRCAARRRDLGHDGTHASTAENDGIGTVIPDRLGALRDDCRDDPAFAAPGGRNLRMRRVSAPRFARMRRANCADIDRIREVRRSGTVFRRQNGTVGWARTTDLRIHNPAL